MKTRKLLSLILALLMALCLVPAAVFAEGEQVIEATDKSVIKVTTAADFAAGTLESLVPTSVGNGALALAEGATEGTFTSAVYTIADFYKMVGSWNAAIYDGTSVEIEARAFTDGAWDDWFSWGKYGMSILRGCNDDDAVDEYVPGGTITKAQFRAVLRRDSADVQSPVLRQMTFSVKGGDVVAAYPETPVTALPASKFNATPAYSQLIRDPEIGGSICSPSTITVLLNARNPELDLIPEELALSVQDFNYGFGNWAFCTSAAGLYGYESYAQYGNKDIILQELANGRSVGLSVSYSPSSSSSYPYLPGSYGGTGGHLISIIGYEYEDGVMDDDHLYFISSDTYSKNDATSFHRYQWKYLKNCWTNQLMYCISSTPESGAPVTGVERIAATLNATEKENVYTMKADGSAVDLTDFTIGKRATLGRGVLAYTVEGIRTTASEASDASIVYENRIQVSANNTFFYTGIKTNDDGNLVFDAADALYKAGIPEGETRTLTVYAMANNGRRYTATLSAVSKKALSAEEEYGTVATDGNLVHVNLGEGVLSETAARSSAGEITLKSGAPSGTYTTPIYSNEWAWEYLMATINAVTPGASSVELQVRAVAELAEGAWSDWFTWGKFGSGVQSTSTSAQDDYLKLGTDMFTVRGSSATANVKDVQFRVILRADDEGNVPTVFGLNFTYKKSSYSSTEAVYTGSTSADALPKSASVDILPTSAYGHASGMAAWRFENMMLMMVNSRGSDALFEEVALNGYDYSTGWGNWAYTIFKAGLFGHKAYTQFGATPTLVQQAIADGNIVGLYIHGGAIHTTNSSSTRQIVVYAYDTAEDGTVTFRYVCASGDASELAGGDVLGTCTAAELDNAIRTHGSSSTRGVMYVVGSKVKAGSVERVPVSAQIVDAATIRLAKDGAAIALPADFVASKTSTPGGGVVAYTLASEVKAGEKLAANKFYYDITVNEDGTLALSEALQAKLAAGDTANLYVIRNNGVTYTAEIVSPDQLAQLKAAANAKVDEFLKNQPVNLFGSANELADKVKAAIAAAASPAEIEAALAMLEAGMGNLQVNDNPGGSGISAGGTVVSNPQLQPATPVDPSPAPPQTGAAASLVPFLCILAAAALFAVSRKRRSC
ncbi:MAG: C39 family peptidase [bacterium]|nr:C39 family peptidase [bacterium]